jgi:hypothetical protein
VAVVPLPNEVRFQWEPQTVLLWAGYEDDRELGGALYGHTGDGVVVVTEAMVNPSGLGGPDSTPIELGYFGRLERPDRMLAGDWHSHPLGSSSRPSSHDLRRWREIADTLKQLWVGVVVTAAPGSYGTGRWDYESTTLDVYVTAPGGNQRSIEARYETKASYCNRMKEVV